MRFGAPGADAPVVAVDRVVDAPSHDIRLLHLSRPQPLASFPAIDLTYTPRAGDDAIAYTVGTPVDPSPRGP